MSAIGEIVGAEMRARYAFMESVLEDALADGFRGWIEFDDSPTFDVPPIQREHWRHETNPGRSTRARGIFFNMATLLPKARA